jgi:hypothetical protein
MHHHISRGTHETPDVSIEIRGINFTADNLEKYFDHKNSGMYCGFAKDSMNNCGFRFVGNGITVVFITEYGTSYTNLKNNT